MDDLLEIEAGVLDGSRVHLDAVVPRISPRIFQFVPREVEPSGYLEAIEPPDLALAPDGSPPLDPLIRWPSGLTIGIAATLAAIAASITEHDIATGLFVAAVVVAAAFVRNASGRATFTFGEGFLGYRSDMGWPRGVQEDDDVHWNWRARPADARR